MIRGFFRTFGTLVSVNHALMLAYRAEIYLWVLAHVFPFIMMGLWYQASRGAPAGDFSLTPAGYVRYFLAAFIVRQFSAVWMIHEFEWHIVEGRLSNHLLKPINPLWHYVTAHLGEQLARFPFFLLAVGLVLVLYPQSRWIPTPAAIGFGILAIYAVFALRFALQYCFAMLAFWFERAAAIEQLSYIPFIFLSGLVAPLSDFPPAVARFARCTPFPYLIDFPARLLTNALTGPEIAQGFAVMAAWFTGLCLLGAFLWRRGIRRYAGQGA